VGVPRVKFPHTVTVYASVDVGDGLRQPGPIGVDSKAFIIAKSTQDIQRFTGSGARLNTVGQLTNITFDIFFPLKNSPWFDGFSGLTWDGGSAGSYYSLLDPENPYFFVGEPEVYMNGHGKVRAIHGAFKRVD
jgi:hypothetical protein